MSCFAKFGDTNAMSNMSVLPLALSRCLWSLLFRYGKVKMFLDVFEHRIRGVFMAQPKYSSFELKSQTNMTLSDRLCIV